jgi:hypothetical protein
MAMSKKRLYAEASISLLIALMLFSQARCDISKPSVPEFTLKVVHYTYDHPAVYGIDPYTGKNVTITPAEHQETTEIVVNITNQQFTSYQDSSGNIIKLYYNVRSKGHFSDSNSWGSGVIEDVLVQNSSYIWYRYPADGYSIDTQLDYQVQAMTGYYKDVPNPYFRDSVFVGEGSGWSNTQTISILSGNWTNTATPSPLASPTTEPTLNPPTPSPTAEPTSTPTQQTGFLGTNLPTEYGYAIVAVLVIIVVAGLSIVYFKKLRK